MFCARLLKRTYTAKEVSNEDDELALAGWLIGVEGLEGDLIARFVLDQVLAGCVYGLLFGQCAVGIGGFGSLLGGRHVRGIEDVGCVGDVKSRKVGKKRQSSRGMQVRNGLTWW